MTDEPDLTIHASSRDLLVLAAVLAKSLEGHVDTAPPKFAHGWLSACSAIGELARAREEQEKALHAEFVASRTPRLRMCVEQWPGCIEGEYDPRCCRFPKSCSCTVYDEDRVGADELEDVT